MQALFRLTILGLVVGLAGCQHEAFSNHPVSADSISSEIQGQEASAASVFASSTGPQLQTSSVITLHLAQRTAKASLVAVDVGGAQLYALPQPVITQSDIWRISSVMRSDKRMAILLEMSLPGISRLRNITEQAQGHYFLLSVRGQLASVAWIGNTVADGRLLIDTQNLQLNQAIMKMMRGE